VIYNPPPEAFLTLLEALHNSVAGTLHMFEFAAQGLAAHR